MDTPDSLTTRRALLGGLGVTLAGGGLVYGASELDSYRSTSVTAPMHRSSATTGFGIDLAGHPIMGSMDAPIDVYYWSDYQCPFCRRFEQDAFPKLVRNHVKAGNVRLVFIEFPYLGDASMTAAVMDRCVWRQVRDDTPKAYLDWHTTVFEHQRRENSEWASRENLLDITRDVEDVDASVVDDCMRANRAEIESSIEADREQASQWDIRGTPAFVIYNREADAAGKLVGAQPYERFDEAIRRVENA